MILKPGHATEYLTRYRDGKIAQGLGIGCDLDGFLRFKKAQNNIVLGHDNVGKTDWMVWYMLVLSSQYDLKWDVWVGENDPAQVVRKLIQMYAGKYFMDLSYKEIRRFETKMDHWFTFIDNKRLYTPDEMLDIYSGTTSDGCLMDPFTGLDRSMQYADNYAFMNKVRLFCNQTQKTLYVITHPNTESGRSSMIYPQGHNWFGHLMPPLKAHIEGGKPFLNRADDMIVLHRLTKHPDMYKFTMVNVEKVKNTETGGRQTSKDIPQMFEFNNGLGYKQGLVDPVKRSKIIEPREDEVKSAIQPNLDFESLTNDLFSKPDPTDQGLTEQLPF
jgi:hypothetical protein